MFQLGDLVVRQKCLDRQGVVCQRIVLVKNPWAVLPHFRSCSSHPFKKVCQNLLVVDLVNGLTFRHPIHMKNPSDVEKNNYHCFKFGFDLPCFLLPWWTGALPVHGLALTFWVILKKKHDLSQVIMFSKKFGPFSISWRMSAQMLIWISFCSGVRSLGTIFEHTFFMLKLLCKICRTFSLSMLINSATARMLRQRFCRTISPLFLC